jgi:hypothetical protein
MAISKPNLTLIFSRRYIHQDAKMPANKPTNGSWIAYIQNQSPPGNIKKINVSVIAPHTNP